MPILAPIASTQSLRGLHLFHYGPSTCSQRVRIALAEKGLAYQGHMVDLAIRAQLSPDFLAINPRGQVPVLIDDGARVVESVDIIGHLDARHPEPSLVGLDVARSLALRDAADRAQEPLRTTTHEYAFRARGELRREDLEAYVNASPDPQAGQFLSSFARDDDDWSSRVDRALRDMADVLDAPERALDGQNWLEGERFGLADIAWLPTAHRLESVAWPWTRWPLVQQWYGRATERLSFATAVLAFEPAAARAALAAYVSRRSAAGTGVAQRMAEASR